MDFLNIMARNENKKNVYPNFTRPTASLPLCHCSVSSRASQPLVGVRFLTNINITFLHLLCYRLGGQYWIGHERK